jgi:surfeit locus 1 family protein
LSGSELRVLVNRGWIAAGSSREILPRVDTPGEEVTVTGVVELPLKPRFTLEDEPIAGGAWPPVWNYLDYERFRRAVPYPVQPVVVLQDADNPFGYARQWSKKNFFRYKSYINVGYAVQWFSFAVMLIVYVAIKSTRRVAAAESAVEQPKAQPLAHR